MLAVGRHLNMYVALSFSHHHIRNQLPDHRGSLILGLVSRQWRHPTSHSPRDTVLQTKPSILTDWLDWWWLDIREKLDCEKLDETTTNEFVINALIRLLNQHFSSRTQAFHGVERDTHSVTKWLIYFISSNTPGCIVAQRAPKVNTYRPETSHGQDIWLFVQASAHRGLRSGKNMCPLQILRRCIQCNLYINNWWVNPY